MIDDFTYYMRNNKHNLDALRFSNYDSKNIVITLYYPFNSINIYFNYNYLIGEDIKFIYESDDDHKSEYHKMSKPYISYQK